MDFSELTKLQLFPGQTLYLDMDGLVADYDLHYYNRFGHWCHEVPDEEMWENVHSIPTFFYDLPLVPNAEEFFLSVRHLNPIFLTACPEKNFGEIVLCKRRWVRNMLDPNTMMIPVRSGRNKCFYMNQIGDVLVDDFNHNLDPWVKRGGVGIHFDYDNPAERWEKAIADLNKALIIRV